MSARIVPIDAAPLSQRRPRNEDGGHLAWLRTLGCIVTGTRPVEAAHIRYADRRFNKRHVGLQEKPSDKWAVPLCPALHREQHTQDEEAFWRARNIDPVVVASALWGVSGDDQEAEAILREHRERARTC